MSTPHNPAHPSPGAMAAVQAVILAEMIKFMRLNIDVNPTGWSPILNLLARATVIEPHDRAEWVRLKHATRDLSNDAVSVLAGCAGQLTATLGMRAQVVVRASRRMHSARAGRIIGAYWGYIAEGDSWADLVANELCEMTDQDAIALVAMTASAWRTAGGDARTLHGLRVRAESAPAAN